MNHANRRGRRFLALALVGGFVLGPAPVSSAAEGAAAAMDPKPMLLTTASAKVASLDLAEEVLALSAPQAAAPAPASDDSGFFKTGKGKVAMVLFAAAAGLTVYSKYHDRVKSGIR